MSYDGITYLSHFAYVSFGRVSSNPKRETRYVWYIGITELKQSAKGQMIKWQIDRVTWTSDFVSK